MDFHQRLWLAMPPVLLCVADAALTLWGQPREYWQGDFSRVLEFNPLGHVLLAYHPWAFAVGVAGYLAIFLILTQLLTRRWMILLTFALSIGHVIGGAGWLAREGITGCLLALCFIIAAERLVGLSWRMSGLAKAELLPAV
jgi:hypothetical protein